MGTLKEQIQSDLTGSKVFFNTDHFAESITYTPKGGTAKTINAVVEYGSMTVQDEEDGKAKYLTASVLISSDATAGVASPDIGDTVTLGSTVYALAGVVARSNYHHELDVQLYSFIEKTRGYRMERG